MQFNLTFYSFLLWPFLNFDKSRENSRMNSHVPISQLQQWPILWHPSWHSSPPLTLTYLGVFYFIIFLTFYTICFIICAHSLCIYILCFLFIIYNIFNHLRLSYIHQSSVLLNASCTCMGFLRIEIFSFHKHVHFTFSKVNIPYFPLLHHPYFSDVLCTLFLLQYSIQSQKLHSLVMNLRILRFDSMKE